MCPSVLQILILFQTTKIGMQMIWIVASSRGKYPAVNVIFRVKNNAVFKKATVFFSYYPPIKCHFPSVINIRYIPEKCHFPSPLSDVASKIQTGFQTWTPPKIFLKINFSFSYDLEMKGLTLSATFVVPLEEHTRFQT